MSRCHEVIMSHNVGRKMTTAMPNYGWFLSQIACFAYVPVFGVVVLAAYSRGDITEVIWFTTRNDGKLIKFVSGFVGNAKISKVEFCFYRAYGWIVLLNVHRGRGFH